MTGKPAFIVVGGDSLIGGGVAKALARRRFPYYVTTRRHRAPGANRIFLDLESQTPPELPADAGYAFVIAAATGYERCERDPRARTINVELIPRYIAGLLERGLFVTCLSSNTVFGGERAWPGEDDAHAPGAAYPLQKSESELRIRDAAIRLGASERLNVVRLTKVLAPGVPPLPDWLAAWKNGRPAEPFSDLIFAPMSLGFVSDALVTIGEKRIAGNLHLSGAENITYVDFADALAERLGIDPALVRQTTATEKGIALPFKPKFSALEMTRTTALTGLQPQRLADAVDDVAAACLESGAF